MRIYRLFNMKFLKLLIFGSIIFFLTLGVSVAGNVNGSDNPYSNSDAGSFSDLNALIKDLPENSTLTLTQDYFSENDDFPQGIVIYKPLTINGNNHIIDANSNSRIFDVSASGVVLNDIGFINGKSNGDGGAVRLGSDGQINNCTFEDNYAQRGGAVFSGYLSRINNSTFINNSASGDGGAVYQCADGYVSDSGFINNSASRGGAVYLDEANIYDSDFAGNSAVNGGAIYMDGSSASTSTFTDNHASDSGGAVFQVDSSVSDSVFINNSAERLGGAVYQLTGRIYDSIFISNSADHGGAIFQEYESSVQGSTFEDNHAKFGCDNICDSPNHSENNQSEDIAPSNFTDNQSDDMAQNNSGINQSLDVHKNKIRTVGEKNNTGNPLGLLIMVLFVVIARVKR